MMNMLSSESGFYTLVSDSRTIFLPTCTGEDSDWAKEEQVGKHRKMFNSLSKRPWSKKV